MNHDSTPTIAVTTQALNLLTQIALENPSLPAPYLAVSTFNRSMRVHFQCHQLDHFEAWREALGVDSEEVGLAVGILSVDIAHAMGTAVDVDLYVGGLVTGVSERPAAEYMVVEDDEGPTDCITIPDDWRARCQPEDPHDGPLHHDYAIARELPAVPHQTDRSAL